MYPNTVKEYLISNVFRGKMSRAQRFSSPFTDFLKFCRETGYDLGELVHYPVSTIRLCILNDLLPPKCDCGNPTQWKIDSTGSFYEVNCSIECRSLSKRFSSALSSVKTRLYEDAIWKKAVEGKKRKTLLKNYNVEHPMHSVELFQKQQKSCFSKNQSGLQGYEPFAYPLLSALYPDVVSGPEFMSDNNLTITWIDNQGKQRRSYPDFFSTDLNSFIEIKSGYTRNLHDYKLMKCKDSLNKLQIGYIILTCKPKRSIVIECYNKEFILE
jgi:hypothetical protein